MKIKMSSCNAVCLSSIGPQDPEAMREITSIELEPYVTVDLAPLFSAIGLLYGIIFSYKRNILDKTPHFLTCAMPDKLIQAPVSAVIVHNELCTTA